MTRQIWEYALRLRLRMTDAQDLQMPAGAQVLSVGDKHETVCVWALVDVHAPMITHRIYIRGSSHSLSGVEGRYIGTVVQEGGLVWHVFDEQGGEG